MKIVEEVLPCSLPVDYFASAAFQTGMYFISYTHIYKYTLAGTLEKYAFPSISPSFSKISATVHGEYIIFTHGNTQTVYNPAIGHTATVTLPKTPTRVLVDGYTVVSMFLNEVYIYSINDTKVRRYKMAQNRLICRYRIKKLARQGERVLLLEEKVLEVGLDLKEKKSARLVAEGEDARAPVFVKRPVLIEPEPVTFCSERLDDIICTSWGAIMKYASGVEVYGEKGEDYKLLYIYKTTGKVINSEDRLEAEGRVFLREKRMEGGVPVECIVELGRACPAVVLQVKETEKVHVLNKGVMLVEGLPSRLVKYQAEQSEYKLSSIEMNREKALQRSEELVLDESMRYLEKYKEIEFFVRDATEEENALYLEKILNSFKQDVVLRVVSLGIMLEKKIEYIKETSEEIKRIEKSTKEKIENIAENNDRIISRVGEIISKIKDIYMSIQENQEAPSKSMQAMLERIRSLKEKAKEKGTVQNIVKLKGEYYLLKEQNRYLLKKLELLG
ncbi:uncharacterized protein NEMAJ01_1790 [Nematocida major]|uniref:uncharacterized protein n=1 Tax=Nematocida major TaxID=1912982 RepID=UPI00200786F4|nr:uncharacterized protein NEMAJ01_1790 [Nematocida major]KAH9386894.1 hypothetical protein NEMAJ01_1790 [Nematocida major]